ncbi:MAG: prepilin-type N-terminal cleavage/methylation domain-containing protein [Dissulfurispiraceae bacterium]
MTGDRTANGFTLLEVMIALAIIGGVLLTLIYSLNYHLGIAGRHEAVTIATMLAKEKMVDAELSPLSTSGDFEAPYEAFHYKTDVTESEFPGFSELSVTVTADKESVTFSELIHNNVNASLNNAT